MIDDRVKIMMLKGEKGDTYDDTELRAEINAKLANTPYIGYTEDGTFELPIHTINDSVTGASSTWSSNKINDKASKVVYTVDIEGYDGSTSPYVTTATCNKTYAEIMGKITNKDFKPETYIHYSSSSEYDYNEADNYDIVDMSGTSSPSFVRIKINRWGGNNITVLHYENDTITVTIKDNEDYSSEIADLQEKQVDVTKGTTSEITLGTNGGDITIFKDVPTQASVNAGTITDISIIGLDTTKYPPASPIGNVLVFANKVSGNAPVYIDGAFVGLYNNQWYVKVRVRNTSSDNLSYDGTTDIMLINMN